MARILVGLGLAAAVAVAWVTLLAHGSQAAPAAPSAVKVVRLEARPAAVPGPAPLPEAKVTIQRTFVSTSGNDSSLCTRVDPCRNFATAIANTTAGGEVIALDSGGYGVFSVDKSITIAGAPGAHVAVTAFTGTGITVNVGASDTVVLRNLYLTGLGADDGIFFQGGGRLFVESVVASGFNLDGLRATAADAQLFVRDSVFRNNGSVGVEVNNASLRAQIADTRSDLNHWGFVVFHGRGSVSGSIATHNVVGFWFALGALGVVSDCVSNASGASGVQVQDDGTKVTLSEVVISNSSSPALYVTNGTPLARIGGSTVTGNSFGLYQENGTLESFGDNLVRGNGINTFGTITAVGKT